MLKPLNPAPPITPEMLQNDLPLVILAAVILAAGLSSLILWRLKSRDPLLLWLGIFALVYAVRLFLANHLVVVATGAEDAFVRRTNAILTYCIPIPLVLFLRDLIGNGWRNSLRFWLWVQVVFAVLGVGAGVFGGHDDWARTINGFIIILGSLLLLIHLFFFYRPESGVVITKVGFVFCFSCVLLNNSSFSRFAGPALEPAGFLVLVVSLGYAAALRTFSREQKLISVEQELATARRIQSSILPKAVPEIAGLEIATRYVPMTAVAGDFYDFLLVDQYRLTIVIADVSGHGVPAALIASMLKVGVAAQRHNASDPAAILTGLNAMLKGVLDGQFVTAACAFIDLDAHTLTYSAAGHPPALLARWATNEVIEIAENGLLLGPFPRAVYTNVNVPFDCGDKLLLYTDGIIEATLAEDGQPFGGEGLQKFTIQHRTSEVSLFADDLIRAVTGLAQEDDLTLVVLQSNLKLLPLE